MDYKEIVNNVNIYGLEESIRGAKFPMSVDVNKLNFDMTDGIKALAYSPKGEGHDNWLNGVIVQFDLTFTIKAWTEAERYHFLDFVSSQSTMHRITRFDMDSCYINYVDQDIIKIIKEKVKKYNDLKDSLLISKGGNRLDIVEEMNQLYLEILYSNPCGMKLTARMTTNYRQLKTIYAQRKNHKLPEWRTFCAWIETLPNSTLIIGENDGK